MAETKTELRNIEFTDEDISEITKIISSKDLFSMDDKDRLKPFIVSSKSQDSNLGILFVKCFDSLLMIYELLKDDENDFSLKIKEYLDWIDKKTEVNELRIYVQECDTVSGGIGCFHYKGKIQEKVLENRKDYLDFITFFNKIVEMEY